MDDVLSVSVGNGNHAMAVKADRTLWAWGYNAHGQIGDKSTTTRLVPVKVMNDVQEAFVQGGSSFALKSNGELWAWGHNYYSTLGNGSNLNSPEPTKIMEDVTHFRSAFMSSMALTKDGTLWAWGLGVSFFGPVSVPTKVTQDIVAVSLTVDKAIAIRGDGSLLEWNTRYSFGNEANMKVRTNGDQQPAITFYETLLSLPAESVILMSTGSLSLDTVMQKPIVEMITQICIAKGHRLILMGIQTNGSRLLHKWVENIFSQAGAVYGNSYVDIGYIDDWKAFLDTGCNDILGATNYGLDYVRNPLEGMDVIDQVKRASDIDAVVVVSMSDSDVDELIRIWKLPDHCNTILSCISAGLSNSDKKFHEGSLKGYVSFINDIEVLETLHYGSIVSFTGPREILPAKTMTR